MTRLHDASNRVRAALAERDDAACAQLLQAFAGGPLPPVTFEDLVAAGLPTAAVVLAQIEAGQADLRKAAATDSNGSYLHAAAAAGAGTQVVAALVAFGCAIDGHDNDGCTALHVAAKAGSLTAIQALLAAGADALARNKMGRTARGQGGLSEEVRAALAEAEEAAKARKEERQEALWGSKVKATQTASACRTGCV